MRLQELGSARKGAVYGSAKDTASTKKWLKMADKYYKNIIKNIGRFPHSDHASSLAQALKAVDAQTSKDLFAGRKTGL